MKTFSIIIPAYNSAKFIDNCLLSIINQNYDLNKIEVFVIDDGSSDSTNEVVSKYKNYKFIKYIKKQNSQWGGVINYAKENKLVNNDYVMVLDSDDMLSKNALYIVNKYCDNHDTFVGSFRKFDGNKFRKKVFPYWFITKRVIKNYSQKNSPFCLPLPYFFKKEIFYRTKNLKEGVAYQDPDFISQIMNLSKSIKFTWKVTGYYYYNRQGNSISQSWDDKRFNAELHACLKCIENNAPEIISYRLNLKEFYNQCMLNNIKFEIARKMHFNWYPIYLRPFYFLIHFFKYKKLFILKQK